MPAVDRVKIGLVGGGPWARTVHGPALVAHPDVAVSGVWTRRPEAGVALAAEIGAPACADLDALLDVSDAVAFAVPPAAQGELAVRAAERGRHLILEKPIAADLAGARAIAAAATGVVSAVVLTLRHDPAVRAWLAGLPGGPAGPETVAAARWLSGALLGGPYATSAWRAESGALLDLGPHVIDLLDAALGPVTAVEWAHRDEPDLTRFGLLHAGGARSTAMLSIQLPIDPSEVEFAVFGPGINARVDAKPADAQACYAHLLDGFVGAVRGEAPRPDLDAARGLRLQEIVDEVGRAC
jgi:predicted dehydrogenase